MARIASRLSALLVLLLVVSACASIPESSEPRAVKDVGGDNSTPQALPKPNGSDPLALVRSFVDSGAYPERGHEAARAHLDRGHYGSWSPPPGLLVVENVDTIPTAQPMPLPEGVQLVTVQADKVGRLLADSSFVPEHGEFSMRLRVERRADGQWRIATPPPQLVASTNSFTKVYRPVPVYFLDHDHTGVAPDLRYVLAQPSSTLPRRVIDLLTTGPSVAMRDAMRTAIPAGVHTKTNTSEARDGALEVNLSQLGDIPPETRRLIAAQVVFSLQGVSNARVRLKEEGTPLLADGKDLRPTDLAQYEVDNKPRSDLPGLAVVSERLVTLDESARPIPGPAGSGEYDVVRAGQSPQGDRLAAVTRRPGGVVLRVGDFGAAMAETSVVGAYMSKPTWRGDSEVWTVVDSRDVARMVRTDGQWERQQVDLSALGPGRPITDLQLSHDGTRAAVIVDGTIVVAGVTENNGRVALSNPVPLPAPQQVAVTALDWRADDALAVVTDSNTVPVYDVSVDGFRWKPYTASNLGQPINAVTVGPGGKVVVADGNAIWESSDTDDVWALMPVPIGGASIPFYPG
ncbi:LpqB family beta-propeller domain-containing protein [Saccharopolyspora griseoalba]|uniref:LpqB family beta-propeller domain-containing protein n=1 Tax=Saccharopolyspora griseoalba TaxID=1431848 RepID=A0ABW2LIZ4_9PSEU